MNGNDGAAKLVTEKNQTITVTFNPSEYNLSKSIKYSDKSVPGTESSIIQYVAGETENLKITLMFDTYKPPTLKDAEEGGTDVRNEMQKIAALTKIDASLHRPPIVTFQYGSLKFSGVITDINQSFTMFLSSGIPVRSKMELTFKSVERDENVALQSPDRSKTRVIKEAQNLWILAHEEYGDAEAWKEIAKANQIMNPLDIKPGQVLKLPPL